MKQKLLIVVIPIVCFALLFTGSVRAQSFLIFKMLDGSEQSKDIASVKKITFVNGNLLINTNNSNQESLSLSAIANVVFNKTASNIETDYATQKAVSVYPNPASDVIYIKNAPDTESEVLIFTVDGRMLLRTYIQSSEQPIDVSRLTQGLYLLKINSWVFKFRKL